MAAAFGGEVKDENPTSPEQNYDSVLYDAYDSLPLGIGYETI